MKKQERRRLTLALEPDLYRKLRYIAKETGRSMNGLITYLARMCSLEYEHEHGDIPPDLLDQ